MQRRGWLAFPAFDRRDKPHSVNDSHHITRLSLGVGDSPMHYYAIAYVHYDNYLNT